MNRCCYINLVVIAIAMIPNAAHAYFGPGAGIGALAAVLGVIGAVLLGLFAIIYYPIKRAIAKKKAKEKKAEEE